MFIRIGDKIYNEESVGSITKGENIHSSGVIFYIIRINEEMGFSSTLEEERDKEFERVWGFIDSKINGGTDAIR